MAINKAWLAAIGLMAVPALAWSAPPEKGAEPAKAATEANSPEGAFKEFLVAVATKDEPALRRVTLPAEGFEALLGGRDLVPADRIAEFRREVVDPIVIKRLKPGDQITLPGGQVVTIQPEQATDDRVVLMPQGAPVPTEVRREKGQWMVDARPIIAARRAVDAARKKAESKTQPARK